MVENPPSPHICPIPSVACPPLYQIMFNVHSWDQIDLASYDTFGLISIAETRQFSRIKYTYFQVRAISKYILLTCVQCCIRILYIYLEHYCPYNATYTLSGFFIFISCHTSLDKIKPTQFMAIVYESCGFCEKFIVYTRRQAFHYFDIDSRLEIHVANL